MANANSPFGLRPLKFRSGAPYNGECNLYYVAAGDGTALGVGDPVSLSGATDATGKYQGVTQQAAPGDTVVGVVVGFKVDPTDLTLRYRKASTERYVWVADSPDLLFVAQEDSVGAALAAANGGQNVDFATGAVDTANAHSGFQLDSSTAATTAALDAKLIRLLNSEDNALGNYAKWIVSLNNHQYANQVAGV